MNENHDSKTGEFSSGGGGAPAMDKTAVERAREAIRQARGNPEIHAAMDQNTAAAHAHTNIGPLKTMKYGGYTVRENRARGGYNVFNPRDRRGPDPGNFPTESAAKAHIDSLRRGR